MYRSTFSTERFTIFQRYCLVAHSAFHRRTNFVASICAEFFSKISLLFLFTVVIDYSLSGGLHAAPLSQVKVEEGIVSGVSLPGMTVFKGIPFAAPPVGNLRWKAPQAANVWTGVRSADSFAPSCMQTEQPSIRSWTEEFLAFPPFSEDCLYLNIWTPAQSASAKLPVMVWLHGGMFTQGGANLPMYSGNGLAAKGVIVVTVNYRLGVFGFLAHPALSAESPTHASGNYSFLDQLAALKWVERNIQSFGGNPDNVTLIGQSAGAVSVIAQIASPLSRGLFKNAIAESGVTVTLPTQSLHQAEQAGEKFAHLLGADSVEALRALPAERIQAAASAFRVRLIIDGEFLPSPIDDLVAERAAANIPMIIGYNAEEGAGELDVGVSPAAYEANIREAFGNKADAYLALYPSGPQATVSAQTGGHDRVMISAMQWASIRAKSAQTPLYFYDFDHALPGPTAGKWGAFHSGELPYVFNTLASVKRPLNARDQAVA